jgi:hypothetical protein
MDKRNNNEPNQSRGKKANAEKHDRLNHGPHASNLSGLGEIRESTPTDPNSAGGYPKPGQPSRYKKVQAISSKMSVNAVGVRTDSRSPAG